MRKVEIKLFLNCYARTINNLFLCQKLVRVQSLVHSTYVDVGTGSTNRFFKSHSIHKYTEWYANAFWINMKDVLNEGRKSNFSKIWFPFFIVNRWSSFVLNPLKSSITKWFQTYFVYHLCFSFINITKERYKMVCSNLYFI